MAKAIAERFAFTSTEKRPRTKDDDEEDSERGALALIVPEGGFFDLAPANHRTNSAFRGGDKVPE
jgi:hypothetical protein